MKKTAFIISVALMMLLASTLPGIAARGANEPRSGEYHGNEPRPGAYHGSGHYPRPGNYRGSGHYYGSGYYYEPHYSYGGSIWIGPGWWDSWWGYPYYPYPYPYYPYPYYYPYYSSPPVVTQQQPSVYVEPAPKQEEQGYWYYCPKSEGYYPYVKRCPEGWLRVVPSPAPQDKGE